MAEAHTSAECIGEAVRLLAEANATAQDEERLHLLRQAEVWLEIAKQRIGEARAFPQESPQPT